MRWTSAALLLPALFLRASIPEGLVFSVDANGQPAIVMCSGVVLTPAQLTSRLADNALAQPPPQAEIRADK